MFKISPIQDTTTQEEYAKACGAEFCPGFFAYSMIDQETGELMGFSQFEIGEKGGFIKHLKPRIGYEDFEAMFILGRATMNFIDLCGKHTCYAAVDAGDATLLSSIGFRTKEGELLFCNMEGFFDGHCSGHK